MSTIKNETSGEFNAIEKALLVLSSFANNNQPIGTIELAENLQLNKTTISRIVNTLKREKFLEQNPLTKQYSLGSMVAKLGKSITQSLEGQISILAQPYCDRLRDEIGETVHFEVLSGNKIYLAYAARGPNPVSVSIQLGDRVYPHAHAGAKCIAAYTHPRLVEKWLESSSLTQYSPRAVIDPKKIRKNYDTIIRTGVSIDNGEFDESIYAVAAPVFDENSRAVASVVIVSPYMRKESLDSPEDIRSLKETAMLITERLLCPNKYEEVLNMYQKKNGIK